MTRSPGIPANQFNDVLTNRAGELGPAQLGAGPARAAVPSTMSCPTSRTPWPSFVSRRRTSSTVATDLGTSEGGGVPAGDAYRAHHGEHRRPRESASGRPLQGGPDDNRLRLDRSDDAQAAVGRHGRLRQRHHRRGGRAPGAGDIDNPYNTYKHEGLPPRADHVALEAAMEAA